jgi:hypothetical protein
VRLAVDDDNPTSRHIIEAHGAKWLFDFVTANVETYHIFEIDLTLWRGQP